MKQKLTYYYHRTVPGITTHPFSMNSGRKSYSNRKNGQQWKWAISDFVITFSVHNLQHLLGWASTQLMDGKYEFAYGKHKVSPHRVLEILFILRCQCFGQSQAEPSRAKAEVTLWHPLSPPRILSTANWHPLQFNQHNLKLLRKAFHQKSVAKLKMSENTFPP